MTSRYMTMFLKGSPPCMRGIVQKLICRIDMVRITPALAGNIVRTNLA